MRSSPPSIPPDNLQTRRPMLAFPKRQHLDWSPVFINPVYQSLPRKIARTTTGPDTHAPLLVQRALALGASSQAAEARAWKASFPDSAICEQTSCMSKRPLPSLFLSYGSQCWQQAELHKHLPFAQKLSAYAHLLVQRALVMGACNQEAKERTEGEFSGLDMRRSVLMALIDSL